MSATANWASADWALSEMDPVPDAFKVQTEEMPASQLAQLVAPGGRPGSHGWHQRQSRASQAHGPQPTKLPLPA